MRPETFGFAWWFEFFTIKGAREWCLSEEDVQWWRWRWNSMSQFKTYSLWLSVRLLISFKSGRKSVWLTNIRLDIHETGVILSNITDAICDCVTLEEQCFSKDNKTSSDTYRSYCCWMALNCTKSLLQLLHFGQIISLNFDEHLSYNRFS